MWSGAYWSGAYWTGAYWTGTDSGSAPPVPGYGGWWMRFFRLRRSRL